MKTSPINVLMLDGDSVFSTLLHNYLTQHDFTIHIESDSDIGVKKALNQSYDLIILDLMLKPLNGFQVIKQIRAHSQALICVITAREDSVDQLLSFELGANDYIHKPCMPLEVLTRLRALLQHRHQLSPKRTILEYEGICLDCSTRLVTVAENTLELTNAEFNILQTLLKSPNQAFSKEELTEFALGRKYTAYDRSIDVHISNLRNKLGPNPRGETWIKTVRGFGYLFDKS